eukprot:6462933-Amphidinium_carterae.1
MPIATMTHTHIQVALRPIRPGTSTQDTRHMCTLAIGPVGPWTKSSQTHAHVNYNIGNLAKWSRDQWTYLCPNWLPVPSVCNQGPSAPRSLIQGWPTGLARGFAIGVKRMANAGLPGFRGVSMASGLSSSLSQSAGANSGPITGGEVSLMAGRLPLGVLGASNAATAGTVAEGAGGACTRSRNLVDGKQTLGTSVFNASPVGRRMIALSPGPAVSSRLGSDPSGRSTIAEYELWSTDTTCATWTWSATWAT